MEVALGILATIAVAYIVYRRQSRESQTQIASLGQANRGLREEVSRFQRENQETREEITRLRRENQEIPQRVVSLLIAEGIVSKARETDVRTRVMQEFPTVQFTVTTTAEDIFGGPTDVSGRHVLGPADPSWQGKKE